MIVSVDMHIGEDGRIYVPVKINDVPKSMLVDTGGFFTEITQAAVDELKLETRHTGLELIGVSGDTTSIATRASFVLGNIHADAMDYMVMSQPHKFALDVPDAAGILASNLLKVYDVDLNFGAKKFNLLSQDHCAGHVLYWPADAVAIVPIALNNSNHIVFPVTLDGHSVSASLDTGASHSIINLDTAQADFSLSPGSADTPPTGHLVKEDGPTVYRHQFKSLDFGGVAIGNPTLDLIPDLMRQRMYDPSSTLEGGTRIPDKNVETGLSQVIIGMDILHHLHVYIAYKEKKIYITPASVPAPAANPSPPG